MEAEREGERERESNLLPAMSIGTYKEEEREREKERPQATGYNNRAKVTRWPGTQPLFFFFFFSSLLSFRSLMQQSGIQLLHLAFAASLAAMKSDEVARVRRTVKTGMANEAVHARGKLKKVKKP